MLCFDTIDPGTLALFLALKSLSYFDDAEALPMPVMLKKVPWTTIKKTILNAVKQYSV